MEPESRASYVEVREIITAKATQYVRNAKGRENGAMACPVPVVRALVFVNKKRVRLK